MLRLSPLFLTPLLLLLFCSMAPGAAPPPRPYSGCGVLFVTKGSAWEPELLALYREPGMLRIAELRAASLPRLSGSASEPLLAASERRGGWTRLSIDDAGRQGWLEPVRGWEYKSWQEFLPGRSVRVLPGLKKGWYALRSAPGEAAGETGTLTRDQLVQVLEVREDWARLKAPAGWFRWRDGDGRLTVALQESR